MSTPIQNFGTVEFGEKLFLGFHQDTWQPGKFSVLDPENGQWVIEEEDVQQYTQLDDPDAYFITIDTLRSTTAGDLFEPRKNYVLIVYDTAADPDPGQVNQIRGHFYVSTAINKKLDRVLAFLGEAQVHDGFEYDQAGNITRLRLRLFDSPTAAENATQGATGPEAGEIAQYDVVQNHQLPRSLRSFHQSFRTFLSDARE